MHPATTALRLLCAVTIAGVLAVGLAATSATPAAAADTTMVFDGRGYGHGRGMSQYGAQGYASQHGWSSAQILNHYYGGTTSAQAGSTSLQIVNPAAVRIRLERMSGRNTRVAVAQGELRLNSDIGSLSVPSSTNAVEIARESTTGKLRYRTSGANSCAPTWSGWTQTAASRIDVRDTATGAVPEQMIRVCPVPSRYAVHDDVTIWYPSTIRSQVSGSTIETLNVTAVEHQLRSVVPNESFPSWDPRALEAQSVAARSYALASNKYGFADTCDTISCQVYLGWFGNRSGSVAPTTDTRTDAPIKNTAGIVRLFNSNGRIASTEFSSTSGGWTAGGTFPAVQDLGDSISPLHTWRRTVSVTPLETAYGSGSKLLSIEVTKRNGLGAGGGRVLEAKLTFANGATKITSGNDIRSRLGLLSDWFFPACGVEIQYLEAVFQLFLDRDPSANEVSGWCPLVSSATERQRLTNTLSVSDEWAGTQIKALYVKILGRTADANGYAYWLGRVRDGYRIEDIAAYFYGGPEYFEQSGGTNRGFVENLYLDLLGRKADDSGRSYWVSQLNNGMSRTAVAANFYASIESRQSRVTALYRTILGRNPDASGLDYWSQQLLTLGDVSLAAYLGASKEYFDRTTR